MAEACHNAPFPYENVAWDVPGSVKLGPEGGIPENFEGFHKDCRVFDHSAHASAVVRVCRRREPFYIADSDVRVRGYRLVLSVPRCQ